MAARASFSARGSSSTSWPGVLTAHRSRTPGQRPVTAADRLSSRNDGALLRTLRAFFDADCSQRTAAERLFVHHKTLRYRLGRIQQLTGLDLGRHEDRMRADLALRLPSPAGTPIASTARPLA